MKKASLLLIAAILICLQNPSAYSQFNPNERNLSVNSSAEIKVWPNIARLMYHIEKENLLAVRAFEDCRKESKKFIEMLKTKELDKNCVVTETACVIASRMPAHRPRRSRRPAGSHG